MELHMKYIYVKYIFIQRIFKGSNVPFANLAWILEYTFFSFLQTPQKQIREDSHVSKKSPTGPTERTPKP